MIVDLLRAAVILALGLKVIATLILLARPPETRLADRRGRSLWRLAKIAPILAVPDLIAIAWIENDRAGLWAYPLLMVFVLVAVPITVWRRSGRSA
ncbi:MULTISPECIES: hypothetical protein [unclassified Sphingomonas]|jgi:hypothetical protein|uniref:hypothetical protein n=1 Tax=unclassified Sphingomonas TaxID=196159 RepID=UPI000ACCB8B0|nr:MULTISPECIES: hypothetical protein [unclassified Sphingomonas]